MPSISLVYSIADQSFAKTKSLGILNVSLHLARYLSESPDIQPFTLLSNSELDAALANGLKTVHNEANQGKIKRILWDQFGVYRAARIAGAQWLFLPKGFASFVLRPPCRLAVYVHDTIFDYYRQRGWKMASRLETPYFEHGIRSVLRNASLILTNSEFTRNELLRKTAELHLPPPNIRAVGIGFELAESPFPQKRERIVVLISRWPHKDSTTAIDFINRWSQQTGYKGDIDFVGSLPEGLKLRECPTWHHHSRLPEAEFRQLIAEAKSLVYYTEYEGFGMPPVEAAWNGACPVYSDIPATRESMLGLGAPFTNNDFDSFTRAMNLAMKCSGGNIATMAATLRQTHSWKTVGNKVVKALLETSNQAPQ